ncbi:MAG: argininosuccinate lyase [Oscillospiraceae bacterium]|jgi:argininosuccinate lyase|nr:argininosuccinate lyase [Oscillospiraceae bacterium]
MSDKLWAGRFSKETDKEVDAFNSSISFDKKMVYEDIAGSIAHARMLGKQSIISETDSKEIIDGLEIIWQALKNKELKIDDEAEDIHMFIEAELTRRIGDAGKKLHTARSRNDQVATDLRLHLNSCCLFINLLLSELIKALCDISENHTETIMPGYTHLQRAQPITFAHHLMAYAQMFVRDKERLGDAVKRMMSECPLGSGALAGTTFPIDREATAKELGFLKPCANSLDGVSDRDFCVEIAGALSLIMVHLSRFSEEIILWCSWEFKFIELDDAYATGSSIMPQKKNPDVAELVRGKSARVFGDLQTLLTVMKGLPLAYNKDMQEDKEAIFDAVDTVCLCLRTFTLMLKTMTVNKENMRVAAAKGFINATDCADYLVGKGMAFRDAYKITGELVARCVKYNTDLENLPIEKYKQESELFGGDIYEALNLETCVAKRSSYGGSAPEQVRKQTEMVRERLEQWKKQ